MTLHPTPHVYHLLHYPHVTHRALLIQDPTTPRLLMIDTDDLSFIRQLSKKESQYYLATNPETLTLTNVHHVELIKSFGIDLV